MSHSLVRTSPTGKGKLFVGYCMKCGAENLGMGDALKDCPADSLVSDEQALLDILDSPNTAQEEG